MVDIQVFLITVLAVTLRCMHLCIPTLLHIFPAGENLIQKEKAYFDGYCQVPSKNMVLVS
jgi:hypothetical protein